MQSVAVRSAEDAPTDDVLPPGLYWVGDLCYVLGDRWDEVCELTISGEDVIEGIFELENGTKFGMLSTCWGDGVYYDLAGRSYPVDAGLIGCVLVSDLGLELQEGAAYEGGHVYSFPEPFEIRNEGGPVLGWGNKNGEMSFGDVVFIDTRQDDEEDEDDYYVEDEYDEEDEETDED